MYKPKAAAVECDYAEVTDEDNHPSQPSVDPFKPTVAPYKCNDKQSLHGQDETPQAGMPPAKPSPYKGTLFAV